MRRVFLQSIGFDPALAMIGGAPFPGDMGSFGLPVPPEGTPNVTHRYLFRLVALQLCSCESVRIIGLRQMLTLLDDTGEHEICGLQTNLPTGNVSWHLRRVVRAGQGDQWAYTAPPLIVRQQTRPGCSHDLYGVDSALLFNQLYDPAIGGSTYIPVNGGQPIGSDVSDMGTFRDLRFGPGGVFPSHKVDLFVDGPCDVAFYASVAQPYVASPNQAAALPRFGHVGAIMLCDILTPDEACKVKTRLSGGGEG